MVFASLKNKIVSFAGTVINQVCLAISVSAHSLPAVSFPTVASPATKAVQDVLPAPVYRAYGFLEELYHPRFQLAKNAGYCLVEEFRKIPVQTEYKTEVEFPTVNEAKAALAADLLDAYRTPLPGNFCRPQTEYKTNLKFDSSDKAQAAMASDLLEACSSSFPGRVCRSQVSDKVSLHQQEPAAKRTEEEDAFEFVDYPEDAGNFTALTNQPGQEINIHGKKKKKGYVKSLKSKVVRFSKVVY